MFVVYICRTMKKCQSEGCNNNVFSNKYCLRHQNERTDPKYLKSKEPKPKTPIKKVSAKEIIRKKGVTEINVFLEIWAERPHVSELSGLPLPYKPDNTAQWVKQFLHVLNKLRFPSLRLDKRNIMLGTPEEHDHQDQYEKFVERKEEMLAKVYIK